MDKQSVKKYTWNLTSLGSPQTMPREQATISRAWHLFKKKWEPRTDYLSSPRILRKALDDYERLQRTYGFEGNTGYYFWLCTQQNNQDPTTKAGFHRAEEFGSRMQNLVLFFTYRIAHISPSMQKKMLASAACVPYKHFLARLFAEAPHLLSAPEEKILTLTNASAHGDWVRMTSSLLSWQERPIHTPSGVLQKNFSQITSLTSDPLKTTRDSAAQALNDILQSYEPVAEAELNAILSHKKTVDDLRAFPRPDTSRHMSDDIETPIVDALVHAVSKTYAISHRYYRLKAKLMHVQRLAYHERNVPLSFVTTRTTYSFEETMDIIKRVLKQLDPSFLTIYESFMAQRRVDVFPQKGKSGGAFCTHGTIAQPVYILLNHTNTLHDVLTFAHELGHGINDELMKRHQNALTFGTTLATAETASTFMEDFVFEELMRDADDNLALTLIMEKLNGDISTIFRQIACYQFEQELHTTFRATGYISSTHIGLLFKKHMAAYMGRSVIQSEGSQRWWIHWTHIRSFFYNYSYASGLLISKALQASVRRDPTYISHVKEFLSTGLSSSPYDIFKKLNLDIATPSFWDTGINEVKNLLSQAENLARTIR